MIENDSALNATIEALTARGKGILAADESLKTIQKRFAPLGIDCDDTSRRDYREMLFSAPGLNQYISGVILYEETLKQKTVQDLPLPQLLKQAQILAGIKVDLGLIDLATHSCEKTTQGLDGLDARLKEFKNLGASFAKWRAVFTITSTQPSQAALFANGLALARYARICQDNGIVPIVEPEILMEGDHDLARSAEITEQVLNSVFGLLRNQNVCLEQMILKPSMVIPGEKAACVSVEKVAEATLKVLLRTVPAAVPSINFLSGGQPEALATAHLNAMNQQLKHAPWNLSFSYGRALQHSSLTHWAGKTEYRQQAQTILLKRARLNSQACLGQYSASEE